MYEVEFPDGATQALNANYLAQNLFAQVDQEGNRHVLFSNIVDYRTDGTEVKQQDAFVYSKRNQKIRVRTTKGWELLVEWKDGSTTWIKLKDMKKSYPAQTAEYAVEAGIAQEPAFAWWVDYILRRRNRIIGKAKSKYWLCTHKFGIRIPKSVKEAKQVFPD